MKAKRIPPELDDYDWEYIFDNFVNPPTAVIKNSKVSVVPFTRKDVAKVLKYENGENDGPNWIAVVKLRDGRFASISAGCDYTGWG